MNYHHALKARYDAAPLSEDMLRSTVPSLFATAAHDSRSDRYAYIPTFQVMRALVKEGFVPMAARQSRCRDDSRKEFTKHMVRFRRNDTALAVGDTSAEVVLVNSHDGTSAYHLLAGLFRLLCLNGMVVDSGKLAEVHVSHKGNVVDRVIEGAYTVLDASKTALAAPRDWSRLALTSGEQNAFAEAAHSVRFADAEGETTTAIRPAQLLIPRRYDDSANNLWTTFNVIQENAIRGGLSATGRGANGRPRRTTSRAVNGIDQDVKLNKALWTLAAKMAELKGAH